jgi:hypothetical protein
MSLYSSIFLLVGALVAGLLTYLQYKDFFLQHRFKAILLGILRWLSYLLVLLLLLNFTLETATSEHQKQQLVVLSDASTSMENFTSEEEVTKFLNQLTESNELQQKFKLSFFTFGEAFSSLSSVDSYSINQSQTNVSDALKEIHNIYRNQKYSLLLISDGNQSIGEDYTYVAKQLNQQIIPVIVGDTTRLEDLRIDRVNHNNYVFLDNKFPVEIFVSYEGTKNFSTSLRILQNDREVARQSISFSPLKNTQRLSFLLLASTKGIQKYDIIVDAFDGEFFLENNTATIYMEIIDDFSKVLILTDKIHPDIGMLQRSIGKSKQRKVEVSLLEEFEDELSDYNLVVLYQPNRSYAGVIDTLQEIGLNALIFTGTQTDYTFVQQKFPYFAKETSRVTEDYYPFFDEDFSIFQQEDLGFSNFPPLQDVFGEVIPKGNTSSLLKQHIQGFKTNSPMLFFAEAEGNRYGFFMGENTWRWRSQYYVDHKDFTAFDDFVGRIIQYLTSSATKQRLLVEHESLYTNKLESELKATFYDANYQLDKTADVNVKLTNTETKETSTYPMLWKGNYLKFSLKNLSAGSYSFEVSANDNAFVSSGSFSLDDDKEKKVIRPDLTSMKSMAFKDHIFLFSEPTSIITYLVQEEDLKPMLKSVKKNQSLIDWQYLLFFLMVSLASEWFIRKYNGLT